MLSNRESHFKLSDDELIAQLKNCSLAPELFSHEAHLRLAWIYLKRTNEEHACGQIAALLQAYVSSLGETAKFNLTLTIAAIKVVNHFLQKSVSEQFEDFTGEFPRLKSHFRELISAHYSQDIFQSEEAKKKYLEPDLLAF